MESTVKILIQDMSTFQILNSATIHLDYYNPYKALFLFDCIEDESLEQEYTDANEIALYINEKYFTSKVEAFFEGSITVELPNNQLLIMTQV